MNPTVPSSHRNHVCDPNSVSTRDEEAQTLFSSVLLSSSIAKGTTKIDAPVQLSTCPQHDSSDSLESEDLYLGEAIHVWTKLADSIHQPRKKMTNVVES